MVPHGSEVYASQKASGKFVRSNAFINGLSKPRTSAACPAADGADVYDAPAITTHSWKGVDGAGGSSVAVLAAEFRRKENSLDYQPSKVTPPPFLFLA